MVDTAVKSSVQIADKEEKKSQSRGRKYWKTVRYSSSDDVFSSREFRRGKTKKEDKTVRSGSDSPPGFVPDQRPESQ